MSRTVAPTADNDRRLNLARVRRRVARASATVITLILVAAVAPAVGRADGDPASDYLLGRTAFVPPDSGVSSSSANRLVETLSQARREGFQIRVALITSRYDMGAVASLWKQPKQYAQFLGAELGFVYKGRLLVVMPNGYGVSRDGHPEALEQSVVDRSPPPRNSAGAADAAVQAVVRLARQAGVAVRPPAPVAVSGSSATRDRLLIAAAAIIAAVVLLAGWQRHRLQPLLRRPRG